jgi:hypothetical protein
MNVLHNSKSFRSLTLPLGDLLHISNSKIKDYEEHYSKIFKYYDVKEQKIKLIIREANVLPIAEKITMNSERVE